MNRTSKIIYGSLILSAIVTLLIVENINTYRTTDIMKQDAVAYAESLNKDVPPNEFSQDGCTLFPNRLLFHDLRTACLEHDKAYWLGGTKEERKAADIALRETISHTGPIGPVIGYVMYAGVRVFGDTWLTEKFNANWGYGWNE